VPPGAIIEAGAFAVVTTELERIWKRRKDLTQMSGQSVELGAHSGVQECGNVRKKKQAKAQQPRNRRTASGRAQRAADTSEP